MQRAAQQVLGRLEEHGWCKGRDKIGERICLGYAMHLVRPRQVRGPLWASVLVELAGERVALWNDAPERTWSDVKALLESLS